VFFYLIGLGAFVLVTGGVIAVVALRSAPEGFEDEDGFVGLTKGDEVLLKQFGHERHYSSVPRSIDLAA
jgi:hypothetical protein